MNTIQPEMENTDNKVVLLLEDNPGDAELTLRALRKNNIQNEIASIE